MNKLDDFISKRSGSTCRKNVTGMMVRFIVLSAFILLLNCVLWSCNKADVSDEEVTDPITDILGKWELRELIGYFSEKTDSYKPQGYIEYRQDSICVWYDYTTKKNTVLEYKLESYTLDGGLSTYYLHFRNLNINPELRYDLPDCGPYYSFTFVSKNKFKLIGYDCFLPTDIFIYKRLK